MPLMVEESVKGQVLIAVMILAQISLAKDTNISGSRDASCSLYYVY
jgi:hypothetical protein